MLFVITTLVREHFLISPRYQGERQASSFNAGMKKENILAFRSNILESW